MQSASFTINLTWFQFTCFLFYLLSTSLALMPHLLSRLTFKRLVPLLEGAKQAGSMPTQRLTQTGEIPNFKNFLFFPPDF